MTNKHFYSGVKGRIMRSESITEGLDLSFLELEIKLF